jgi:ParB-like chromosome segregation protein Spo0J
LPDAQWRGAEDLRPLLATISGLRLDAENARRHPERNLEAIRASLREFGQRKPVVVRGDVVIAGNGLLTAALAEGWAEVAIARADDLDESEARAYAIADNQTGDLAMWNAEALRSSLASVPARLKPATGFNTAELEAVATMAFGKSGAPEPPRREKDESFVTIVFTADQAIIIEGAVMRLRQTQGDQSISPSRAIELFAADYLAGQ